MLVQTGHVVLVAVALGSLFYAYKYRVQARWEGVSEYLRKGWPVFTPLNCLLYVFTQRRARKSIVDLNDFPELKEIRDNWETIKAEAVQLYEGRHFDQTNKPGSQAYYDI